MFDTSSDGIRSLIAGGESATVEFKSSFTFEALRRHAFAFANAGGGIIIFGIAANGQVLGLSDSEVHTAFSRLRSRLLELRGIPVNYGAVSLDSKKVFYVEISGRTITTGSQVDAVDVRKRLRDFAVESVLVILCLSLLWYISPFLRHAFGLKFFFNYVPEFEPRIALWVQLTLLSFFSLVFYGTAFEITPLRLVSVFFAPFIRAFKNQARRARERDAARDAGASSSVATQPEIEEDIPPPDKQQAEEYKQGTEIPPAETQVAEEAEQPEDLTAVLLADISARAEFLAGRMEKRTNVYMILGTGMGLIGLGFWYWSFRGVVGQHYVTFTEFAQATLPRITILLFIELFAGFFLRQYRVGVEDFKYFFEVEHRADWRRISYAILNNSSDKKAMQKLAFILVEADTSGRLKKGESTAALEMAKAEGNIALEAIKVLSETAKSLGGLAKKKDK